MVGSRIKEIFFGKLEIAVVLADTAVNLVFKFWSDLIFAFGVLLNLHAVGDLSGSWVNAKGLDLSNLTKGALNWKSSYFDRDALALGA